MLHLSEVKAIYSELHHLLRGAGQVLRKLSAPSVVL